MRSPVRLVDQRLYQALKQFIGYRADFVIYDSALSVHNNSHGSMVEPPSDAITLPSLSSANGIV